MNELITSVILAGGRASRMQYQDKGLVIFKQKPMICHIIERLEPQVAEILISANNNIEQYQQYVKRVIRDERNDFPGPMAGICAALKTIQSDYLLIVPCDGPLLPPDLAERLLQGLLQGQSKIATVHDGQYKQPTYSLISADMTFVAEEFLACGERKLGKWLQLNGSVLVDFSDQPEAFVNINSANELNRLENN